MKKRITIKIVTKNKIKGTTKITVGNFLGSVEEKNNPKANRHASKTLVDADIRFMAICISIIKYCGVKPQYVIIEPRVVNPPINN